MTPMTGARTIAAGTAIDEIEAALEHSRERLVVRSGEAGEPRVVDLRQRNRAEAMLVELVELHHLHGARDDLGESLRSTSAAVELAGHHERFEVAIVDRVADLGERAQIRRVERRRVEVPVVRHDRCADLEAARLLAVELFPQAKRRPAASRSRRS